MVKFLRKMSGRPLVDINLLQYVNWQSYGTSLVHDSALNSLPNPPSCVRRKAKTTFRVEFLNRAHQSQVPFLDQIE